MKKTTLPAIVTVPNCITSLRIVGTLCLIFMTSDSTAFYIVYTLCGISDVLDGWIARATNSISEFGSKLDSIADLLFYIVTIAKLLPALWRLLPTWIWYMVGGIVVLRVASYTTAAIKFRRFSSMHTRLNKVSSAAAFLLPYSLLLPGTVVYCFIICTLALLSSAQELVLHISRKEYEPNRKGLF